MTINSTSQIQVAIAWCLAYTSNQPNNETLQSLRQHFYNGQPCTDARLQLIVTAVRSLSNLAYPDTIAQLQNYTTDPLLWQSRIGMVYGGATKIKPYVFDLPKLHEIRGASALLDNINLVDLPAFFHADESDEERFKACRNAEEKYREDVRKWLADEGFGKLMGGLIHELIIYSTGGNILAFCPPDLVVPLANAIEKRYATETLVANSCAVGQTFKPLELCFGLLPDLITDDFRWLEHYQQNAKDQLVQAYLKIQPDASPEEIQTAFRNRKSFNEITSQLAILFNQRRAGNDVLDRSSRRYPVMFETHPYLRRDNAEKRSAVLQADLPNSPWYSEPSARKRIMGQITKRDDASQHWYQRDLMPRWNPNPKAESWIKRFEDYLEEHSNAPYYSRNLEEYLRCDRTAAAAYRGSSTKVWEAQTAGTIGNASNPSKYIAYIYADGNNMGGYIQEEIKMPEKYRQFSEDISKITEESVYEALAEHLTIHYLQGLTDPEEVRMNNRWIHPFEIITVGGDDVFLIVPADKALQIAQTIGKVFEEKLLALEHGEQYQVKTKKPEELFRPADLIHRYKPEAASQARSQLSMSIGVLITAEDTPIAYAESLTEQLLKSAKEKAKALKQTCEHQGTRYEQGYYGGTIDFQVLKSVTMISSKISEFRKDGLVKTYPKPSYHLPFWYKWYRAIQEDSDKVDIWLASLACYRIAPKDLHFYATPYTLHEIGGLIKLIENLKAVDFPRSQLYQIRSFLEKGKRTAILNYRYFRVRLKPKELQDPLIKWFEDSWCAAKENNGNIAPWMYYAELPDPTRPAKDKLDAYYETLWRELVDLYEFIPKPAIAPDGAAASLNAAEVTR